MGPGLGDGYAFSGLGEVAVTDDGSVIFLGAVEHSATNTVKEGIWIYRNGVVSNLIIEGHIVSVGVAASFSTEIVSRLAWDQDSGLDAENNRLALSVWFESGRQAAMILEINISGDLDGDGFVGIADLNTVVTHWNQSIPLADLSSGDTNGDGFVGIDDLNAVLRNWNTGTLPLFEAGAAIPEPATLMLMGVAGVGLCQRSPGGARG